MKEQKNKTLNSFWPFEKFLTIDLNISDIEREQIKVMLNYSKSVDPTNTTTYGQRVSILELPSLTNLKKQIIEILNDLNLTLLNNWGQLYKKGEHIRPHIHIGSKTSGILYVDGKTTKGTYFVNTIDGHIYEHPFKKNELVLFPSNLMHYVPHEIEDNGRTVLAFNAR